MSGRRPFRPGRADPPSGDGWKDRALFGRDDRALLAMGWSRHRFPVQPPCFARALTPDKLPAVRDTGTPGAAQWEGAGDEEARRGGRWTTC
ncbi:hypothetical protein GCM10010469_10920 [Streptomyces labedae]|uniref:Uncharacterized protein n=1 Tax=Streptomyces labedae TaxID=285569 RepID=A0ABP6QSK9_9ACTN